ncbi:MAG: glycoside hydrolase family 19 protein [Pikeienuella sp.]|uniref:glycoside hydrolase family 19 protein n=1 Tax=Pikeienuella sp. TaxID=2831957 RepID=UPI00391BDD94
MTLSVDEIMDAADAAMPKMKPRTAEELEAFAPSLTGVLATPNRAAVFFANLGHESKDLTDFDEDLHYRKKRLAKVWPSRFANDPAKAARCAMNPVELANSVYCDRLGNGPYESGDGYRFRGSGPTMLTGRANFREAGQAIGVDLEGNPDLAREDLVVGLKVARWFYDIRGVFEAADEGNWKKATRRVNGGLIGHDDRVRRIRRVLAVLNEKDPASDDGAIPTLTRVLREGVRGLDVADMQKVLDLVPDGVFGPKTRAAVQIFQQAQNLKADGIVGAVTRGVFARLGKLF